MPSRYSKRKGKKRPSRRESLQKYLSIPLVLAGVVTIVFALVVTSGGTAYALHQENNDAFCASCHTQPESQYFQQSQAQTPVTLAAFHAQKNVRCIDCHSGGGPFGRLKGLEQGAQDIIPYYSGHYTQPAVTTHPLSDDSCIKCHLESVTNGNFNNHYHFFLSRWQSVDSKAAHCVDCHTSHVQNPAGQSFLAVATVQNVCEQCHAVLAEGR